MGDRKLDEVVQSNKLVLEKLEGVKDLSDTFSKGLTNFESFFEKNVASHSEQSVAALNSMNKNMEKLLSKFDTVPKVVPSNNVPVETVEVTVTDTVDDKKVRKGKLFSSSVSLGCDKEKLEIELDCQLEIIETYHIIENQTAPDPEKYLTNMLNSHMKEGEADFIILSVGSNDITFLSNDKDVCKLNKEALEHSAVLVDIAKETADKFGIDVFVIERPSRYDKKDKDPKAVKTTVNQSANGLLVALTSVLDNVHTIKLPALENLCDKARKSIYKNDGIHLTKAGLVILEDKLIEAVKAVYTDIEQTTDNVRSSPSSLSPLQRDGARGGSVEPGHGRGGGGYVHHGYGRRDDRVQNPRNDRREFRGQPADQRRYNDRNHGNWNNNNRRQEPHMQNMMRDFMAFMENGPGSYSRNGGRGRY